MLRIFTIPLLLFLSLSSLADEVRNSSLSTKEIALAYFKSYKVNDVKISPSGKFISLMQNDGDIKKLFLLDTHSFSRTLIIEDTFDDHIEITDFHWIDDNSILLETYIKGKGRALIASDMLIKDYEIKSIETKHIIDHLFIVNPLPELENEVIIGKTKGEDTSLYKIDTSKRNIQGQLRSKYKLNKKMPRSKYWLTNFNGDITVGWGFDKNENKNKVWVRNDKTRKWQIAWEGDRKVRFTPILLSQNKKHLYVISNEKDDFSNLYKYDIVNKKYIKKLYGTGFTDITSAILTPRKDDVLGVSYIEGGFLKRTYFSNIDRFLNQSLERTIDESKPYVIGFNLDKNIALIETSSSTDPGTYHLFKVKEHEIIKFSSKAPWLKDLPAGTNKIINSTSIDGQLIESYLTLPPTTSILPPLIVLPHGGPISVRDTRHFNPHVQLLSALGYAILQPNYRGSSGFGEDFKNKGMKQWGRLIESDIQSGINEVITQGLIDPNKICIYGISYGGYSALISAISRPDIFKCAASYAGVTDLPLLFNDTKIKNSKQLTQLLTDIVGDPHTEIDTLMLYSPVYQAKKVSVPVFIAQGDQDNIVDIEHYYRMKVVLDVFGKDYQTLRLEGEGHGFKYLNNIVSFYIKLDDFFRKALNLMPGKDNKTTTPPT